MEFSRSDMLRLVDGGDLSREGMGIAKLTAQARMLHPSNMRAVAKLDTFAQVDLEAIANAINNRVELAILDVDELLAPHHGPVLAENVEKIREMLAEGVKIAIYSNSKATQRLVDLYDQTGEGIYVHSTRFPKPRPEGFTQILNAYGLPVSNAIMVGDNPLTDGGSNLAGVEYVQVAPIAPLPEERLSVSRRTQMASREFAINLSAFYDDIYGRTPLTGS